MSKLPPDPFGRSSLPAEHQEELDRRQAALDRLEGREERMQMLIDFTDALMAGRMPSREVRLFVAGSFDAWLENGGHLTRDFLRVDAVRGSQETPRVIARRLRSRRRNR